MNAVVSTYILMYILTMLNFGLTQKGTLLIKLIIDNFGMIN